MNYTLLALAIIAAAIAVLVITAVWARFCWRISDGEWWGFALVISPVLVTPLGIGLYLDFSA